jgi:peptidoglycan/LPS O-acetylase OafA/YrhL
MKYRSDIDGLRAISVIAVIIFHSGFEFLSGGYVGVDIFFVISGYLITGLVFDEVKAGTFTYASFYKRRIARLLPTLCLTLLMVFVFGLLFYDNHAFDNLGKEIFFSAIGAANILFGHGVNYFAQEEAVRPLIHLWSLGVEEQFYLVWPTVLICLASLRHKNILLIVLALFSISFVLAIVSVEKLPIETYFYPQYRAFELIIGALTALGMRSQYFSKLYVNATKKEIISLLSIVLIISPMFLLDKDSTFPGVNTLWPCIGTALFIAFAYQTAISKVLGFNVLVYIGLISYPLYLYHQPIISYIQFFELTSNKIIILSIVLFISIPLAWLTYRYIEKPIRRMAHKDHQSSLSYIVPLTGSLGVFAIVGIIIGKTNGLGMRFQILNPFSYQVTKHNTQTFYSHFSRGLKVSQENHGRVLFIGDSVLQQYVYPLIKTLNIDKKDVDTATAGGCILLKGVESIDNFTDISCNDLRNKLYNSNDKVYDYIVLSQSWSSYGKSVLNIDKSTDKKPSLKVWTPFLDSTVEHFKALTNNLIIIGSHLKVDGTKKLNPTIFLSEKTYRSKLNDLKVSNLDDLEASRSFFERWHTQDGVMVIHPADIWFNDSFILHDGEWSFFSDHLHASSASTEYLVEQLSEYIPIKADD